MVKRIYLLMLAIVLLSPLISLADVKTKIVFWHHEPPAHRVKAVQTVIDAFTSENPNIEVIQETVPWNDAWPKTLAAIGTGTTPDFQFDLPDLNMQAFEAGGLIPVTDIVKKIDTDQGYFKAVMKPYFHDGEYWGVPAWHSPIVMIYRPSLLKNYLGTDKAPKTWDELLTYSKKLTVGNIFGSGLVAGKTLCTPEQMWGFMQQAGSTLFDKDGKVDFNSPNTIKAVQFLKDLYQYSPKAASGWSWGELEMNFPAGNIAMMPYFGAVLKTFSDENNTDLASAELPRPKDGQRGAMVYPFGIQIFKATEKKGQTQLQAVKSLIMFMMSPKINYMLTAAQEPGLWYPATKANLDAKNFWEYGPHVKYREFIKPFADTVNYGSLFGFTYGANNLAIGQISGENVLAEMFQKVVVEKMAVNKAVEWAHNRMVELSSK